MTLTKEWLRKTIAELEEERDAVPGAVNEDAAKALAAMKLALASLEAEAVAYVDPFAFHNFIVYRAGETDNKRMGREWMWANPDAGLIPVYTAPPAPVSVPDDVMAAMQKVARIRLDLDDFDGDKRGILDCLGDAEESLIEVVNRRAAMLHGAENAESPTTMQTAPSLDSSQKIAESPSGNSPVIPDCSCGTCRPVTFTDSRFVVCSECGNKRCPHANDHRNACTGSNEPGQKGSAYPAAPQQEVTQALAKGMERYGDAMQELAKKEVK